MSYSVDWHPKVRQFLKKLPKETSSRIVNKMNSVLLDPFHYLEHYEGENFYKLRIGEYRLLIDVDFTKKILNVQVLGHRKNVYERLK